MLLLPTAAFRTCSNRELHMLIEPAQAPAMLMGVFEWVSWDIVSFLAGLCADPKTTLATNALLSQIISLAYCVSSGLSTGVQTLVGNALGAGHTQRAIEVCRVGFGSGVVCMALQCVLLYFTRNQWAALFKVPDVPFQ